MQAVRFTRFGGPDVLTVEARPTPQPGADEVIVAVHAAAVNPSDVQNVQGRFPHTTLPRTPGRDFAGVVVEAGPSAETWIGRDVFGTGNLGFDTDGSHAQHLVVPVTCIAAKPPSLPFRQAASVGVAWTTAYAALLDRAHLQAGETVLIIGGGGAVGSAATQIARQRGAQVLATVRRQPTEEALLSSSADMLFVTGDGLDWAQTVRGATGGKGAHVVFNTVGGPTLIPSLAAAAEGGRIVVISAPGDPYVPLDTQDFYRRDLSLLGLNPLHYDTRRCAKILTALAPGWENGSFPIPPVVALPLTDAPEAYRRVRDGSREKIVLVP